MRFYGSRGLGNALARLHQANRRAAAFEARCAQLLEENERLRGKLAETEASKSRITEAWLAAEGDVVEAWAERDESKAAAEHWRLFHHRAEQRARDAEAENEQLADRLGKAEALCCHDCFVVGLERYRDLR